MSFLEDHTKTKKAFWVIFGISCTLFVVAGIVGYFCYQALMENKGLVNDLENLKNERQVSAADLKKENEDLTRKLQILEEQNKTLQNKEAACEKDKADLTTENKNYQDKIQKALTYNEFFKYENSIIELHGDFSGWTDAEYQTGRSKAQATGDSNFVSTVDWAWNRQDIDPFTRAVGVWKAIAAGIENSLK